MSRSQNVVLTKEGMIATIALNRPDKLNAINDALLDELMQAFRQIEDMPEIKVVLLKGNGRSFSVGQDLSGVGTSEVMPPNPYTKPYESEVFEMARRRFHRLRSIVDFPRFTIAQVHGYCLGLGCELALCCQAIIASDDAIFGDPSIRMGFAPSNALWTWRVGLKKATELLLTGQYIDGREAERIGLVMSAVPLSDLEKKVQLEAQSQLKLGSIGGFDMQVTWGQFQQASFESAGLSAAWRLSTNLYSLSAISGQAVALLTGMASIFIKSERKRGSKQLSRNGTSLMSLISPTPGQRQVRAIGEVDARL
jgi:enoyl-CoA hydratase/carnithine racemase